MKICLILEGCYPYTRGGVSSWTDNFIRALSNDEFIIWTVSADRETSGKYKYELPENLTAVHEVFLQDAYKPHKIPGAKFSDEETNSLLELINCGHPDWDLLFSLFKRKNIYPETFLKHELFLNLLIKICEDKCPHLPFSDVYYTIRSMILPLLHVLTCKVPEADIYHSIATGYSGILGVNGVVTYNKPLIISEHGIYTREREEEILRAKWTENYLKDIWINFFYMLSRCAYEYSSRVTSLFNAARDIQINLGCPEEKTTVIANGVRLEKYDGIQPKVPDGYIDITAIVRIAPIKDIKTMIYSFSDLKDSVPNARLHILGDVDDEIYNKECHALVEYLRVKDVFFVGNTNVIEFLKHTDFTVLTSISEGQPLSVIESLAAGRPVVATNVGSCRELLEGTNGLKSELCGYICPPMDYEAIAAAMKRLCQNPGLREDMGVIGRKRIRTNYVLDDIVSKYRNLYTALYKGNSANEVI